jgi:uncharacterized surface anchored protein
MKDKKLKSFLIIPLCLLLLGSVIAPSIAVLNDLKMEFTGLVEISEEEISIFEKECSKKEMFQRDGQRPQLHLSIISWRVNDFRQLNYTNHSGDVFLPPPEVHS